jgi:subtilisin family serine protease
MDSLRRRNVNGRELDWALVEPLIRLDPQTAPAPPDPHGTHVAGILAGGDLPTGVAGDTAPFRGVCPDIQLYDLRVFADDGENDEFTILAAIEYISWINRDPARPIIHGVNLSLATAHVVDAHACGRTPICESCNRLSANGTVVVAAAGNSGFDKKEKKETLGTGYRSISITDPGNAEDVITVGATHRNDPHTYGVSYFSSRGPTGDGRMKPDLVAPGEKIRSTAPGGKMLVMDGTSMAAPHVSGVCALLMARHRELIGHPRRIKEVLMRTATDLGRERSFQGAGLVDALRALQSL